MTELDWRTPPSEAEPKPIIFPACSNESHVTCPATAADLKCSCECHIPEGAEVPLEIGEMPKERTPEDEAREAAVWAEANLTFNDASLTAAEKHYREIEVTVDGEAATFVKLEQPALLEPAIEDLISELIRIDKAIEANDVAIQVLKKQRKGRVEGREEILTEIKRHAGRAEQTELPFDEADEE